MRIFGWFFQVRRNHRKAFTLVEAILAMSIMAIAVTGILGSYTGALVGGSIAEDYTMALMRAQQVMTRIRAGAMTPYDINQGTFSDDSKFLWTVTFDEVDVDYLYEVELTIAWTRAGRQRELKLTTYQYCDPLALPVSM